MSSFFFGAAVKKSVPAKVFAPQSKPKVTGAPSTTPSTQEPVDTSTVAATAVSSSNISVGNGAPTVSAVNPKSSVPIVAHATKTGSTAPSSSSSSAQPTRSFAPKISASGNKASNGSGSSLSIANSSAYLVAHDSGTFTPNTPALASASSSAPLPVTNTATTTSNNPSSKKRVHMETSESSAVSSTTTKTTTSKTVIARSADSLPSVPASTVENTTTPTTDSTAIAESTTTSTKARKRRKVTTAELAENTTATATTNNVSISLLAPHPSAVQDVFARAAVTSSSQAAANTSASHNASSSNNNISISSNNGARSSASFKKRLITNDTTNHSNNNNNTSTRNSSYNNTARSSSATTTNEANNNNTGASSTHQSKSLRKIERPLFPVVAYGDVGRFTRHTVYVRLPAPGLNGIEGVRLTNIDDRAIITAIQPVTTTTPMALKYLQQLEVYDIILAVNHLDARYASFAHILMALGRTQSAPVQAHDTYVLDDGTQVSGRDLLLSGMNAGAAAPTGEPTKNAFQVANNSGLDPLGAGLGLGSVGSGVWALLQSQASLNGIPGVISRGSLKNATIDSIARIVVARMPKTHQPNPAVYINQLLAQEQQQILSLQHHEEEEEEEEEEGKAGVTPRTAMSAGTRIKQNIL